MTAHLHSSTNVVPSAHEPVIVILGPTASGKSDLAQQLALRIRGEVINADSMQIYRGMDIGTGKVTADERLVPHYLLDIVDPGASYSAALFQRDARRVFAQLAAQHKRSILCGGTGFYIRAAIDAFNFAEGEQEHNEVREFYQRFLAKEGAQALWRTLHALDSASAQIIPVNDTKRIIRALELHEQGESYAVRKVALKHIGPYVPAVLFGLHVSPDVLRKRIDARIDAMFEQGFVHEVESLLRQGFRKGLCAPSAIGYKELVAYLDGTISLESAREAMKTATHRYAKRQRTYFRQDTRIQWIDYDTVNSDEACAFIQAKCATLPVS